MLVGTLNGSHHQQCMNVCMNYCKSLWTKAFAECRKFKGPILYCFSSISYSCKRSNNTVFEMSYPKPIHGPEFQLSRSCSTELYSDQAVSEPAPLNANELRLSMPTWRSLPATSPSGRGCHLACGSGSMC